MHIEKLVPIQSSPPRASDLRNLKDIVLRYGFDAENIVVRAC